MDGWIQDHCVNCVPLDSIFTHLLYTEAVFTEQVGEIIGFIIIMGVIRQKLF